jgi:hypothetical protein
MAAAGFPGLLDEILAAGLPVSRFVVRNLRGDLIDSSPVGWEPGELPSLLIQRHAILRGWLPVEPGVFRPGAQLPRSSGLAGGTSRCPGMASPSRPPIWLR